jgi:transcriptional regulator with XRE-family HTH domain
MKITSDGYVDIDEKLIKTRSDGYVDIDVQAAKKLMKERGLTQKCVAKLSNCLLSRQTIGRALCSRKMLPHNLIEFAKVLDVPVARLLPQTMISRARLTKPDFPPPYDCEIIEYVYPMTEAINGLLYCVAKLKSSHVAERLFRGKYYDACMRPIGDSDEIMARVRRHAEVCTRLHSAKYLAKHCLLFSFEGNVAFWVLDEWIDGNISWS